eukprot:6211813-Pleurochrysis_carterae.AAC.1
MTINGREENRGRVTPPALLYIREISVLSDVFVIFGVFDAIGLGEKVGWRKVRCSFSWLSMMTLMSAFSTCAKHNIHASQDHSRRYCRLPTWLYNAAVCLGFGNSSPMRRQPFSRKVTASAEDPVTHECISRRSSICTR